MKCKTCQAEWNSPKNGSLSVCPFCNSRLIPTIDTKREETEVLKEIINQYGPELLLQNQKLNGLLLDYISDKKLQKLLINAVKENVAQKVYCLIAKDNSDRDTGMKSITANFKDELSLTQESAFMAVSLFGYVCGIVPTLDHLPLQKVVYEEKKAEIARIEAERQMEQEKVGG